MIILTIKKRETVRLIAYLYLPALQNLLPK